MRRVWMGVAVGSVVTAAGLLFAFGPIPVDGFLWSLFAFLVAAGGLIGGGAILAWQHVRERPRRLWISFYVLVLLSFPILGRYYQRSAAVPSFREEAVSGRGIVTGRNVFGALLVTYHGPYRGEESVVRLVAERHRAHRGFEEGDSIWVFVEPVVVGKPRIEVWPLGPDLYMTLRLLLITWLLVSVPLLGYGPLMRQTPSKQLE